MLQGEIKRDFQHNYLVFPAERERRDYQMQMLVHQKIPGVLPCMIRRVDGRQLFSYDISEKVSMKQVFEGKGMDYEDLERLLQTLGKVVESMKDYLLDMELLVLMPEYIFCEERTKQWFFVCFPREEENVYHAFHELSKYFLTVLNHKEERAVQMGYALYRGTMNENFYLGQILSHVQEQIENKEENEEKASKETAWEEMIEQGEIMTVKEPSLWQESAPPSVEFREKKKGFSLNRTVGKQKKRNTNKVFGQGNSRCVLKGITKPKMTLEVESFPYLIGSLECAVDGYIDSDKVSHFHARIQKEGEDYYITDLDSKMGTYINGQRIASKMHQKIADGHRIAFGDTEFAFVCK